MALFKTNKIRSFFVMVPLALLLSACNMAHISSRVPPETAVHTKKCGCCAKMKKDVATEEGKGCCCKKMKDNEGKMCMPKK